MFMKSHGSVKKVAGLVVRDENGEIYTVRYDAVNAMLLNEFLKQHRRVEEYGATITNLKSNSARQEAIIVRQQKQIEILTTGPAKSERSD
jgi:hypothetical protein